MPTTLVYEAPIIDATITAVFEPDAVGDVAPINLGAFTQDTNRKGRYTLSTAQSGGGRIRIDGDFLSSMYVNIPENGTYRINEPPRADTAAADKAEVLAAIAATANVDGLYPTGLHFADDDANDLQNVKVTVWDNTLTNIVASGETDVDGLLTGVSLDAGTYTVTARLNGYQPVSEDIVVTEAEDFAFEMPRIVITPSSGDAVTGWLICYDDAGAPEEGVLVQANLLAVDGTGRLDSGGYNEVTSDVNGLVEFVDYFVPGGKYAARYSPGGEWIRFIADDATFELPNIRK